MRQPAEHSWCILRTSGRATLRLARSLAEDGFEAWAPVDTQGRGEPSSNAKFEVKLAILPSFVFVRGSHLFDMLHLAGMAVKPRRGAGLRLPAHPDFRVMRSCGKIPFVTEADLAALRRLEVKRKPRQRALRAFEKGAVVRAAIEAGSFGGMIGRVVRSDEAKTAVCFSGKSPLFNRVEIPTFLLSLDEVYSLQAATDLSIAA